MILCCFVQCVIEISMCGMYVMHAMYVHVHYVIMHVHVGTLTIWSLEISMRCMYVMHACMRMCSA
jgi:hypothetical protein